MIQPAREMDFVIFLLVHVIVTPDTVVKIVKVKINILGGLQYIPISLLVPNH